jgi:nucleotide-binding universal stress UspA family protein
MSYAAITEARLHAAEQVLAEALTSLPESISATSEVRDGDPAEQLLEVSRDADLLVLGSHGRGFVGRLIMGSVCDRVVRAAACAVLVVPPSKSGDVAGSVRLSPAISSAHGS